MESLDEQPKQYINERDKTYKKQNKNHILEKIDHNETTIGFYFYYYYYYY